MDVVEREVAPHVAHVVAVRTEQLADDALGLPAVRTLEVAVLDERHRRVVGAANVVAVGVDLIDQVEDVVGGAPNLAGSDSARSLALLGSLAATDEVAGDATGDATGAPAEGGELRG